MLFHYFDHFLTAYESRFKKEYGFLRPIIKEVVDRIINHLNLTFVAERLPPAQLASLMRFSPYDTAFYTQKKPLIFADFLRAGS